MKKLVYIVVLISMVLLAASSTVIADWKSQEISGTVDIVEGEFDFTVFDDIQMTIVSENWTFEEALCPGGWVIGEFTIRGEGTESGRVTARLKEGSDWLEIRTVPEEAWIRPYGWIQTFNVYLLVKHDIATDTTRSFKLEFYEIE